MKWVWSTTLMTICLISVNSAALGQSLSQQLIVESPAALAAAAREHGSAVRGAILFAQQKLGCANCHVPGNASLLGPDLTRPATKPTDDFLVEAVLNPSKEIRKGFETVTVVLKSGRSVNGRIVEQNPEKLVLRDTTPDRRLLTMAKSEVEESVPGTVSGMPDKLVDQLKGRQQFLDLVRYLMEISTAGAAAHQTHSLGGGQISEPLRGQVLIKEFHCAACHQDDHTQSLVTVKHAPNLSWSGGRINPDYIQRYIAEPLKVKPGTTMPDMMAALTAEDRRTTADAITHYLVSLSNRSFKVQPLDPEAAQRGGEMFHSIGCVACHSPRNADGRELLPKTSVPLGTLNEKYNIDGLTEFLRHPHEVRPSGRMPDMQLTHWEALDIAQYLLAGTKTNEPFQFNSDLVKTGKTHFQQLGCVNCHRQDQATDSAARSLPLSQVRLDRGCLSQESGAWPRFSLTDAQRNAIHLALARPAEPLTDADQIAMTLTALRCVNCHQRDELGGVSSDRNPHFQTTNPNLGPQGRLPPTLTGVGAKLKPSWLRQVLVTGRVIRPYIKTRMPQYGKDNVAHLVDLFPRTDQLPQLPFAEVTDEKAMRTAGFDLVGTGGLNCIVCHTFQLKPAATMSAVDLTEMSDRLQKNWFYHYMRDPQRLSQNTVMPSFWPGGRAIRQDVLEGDTNRQIEALWQYLLEGRQARTPRGLIQEPIELLATDEAVMLRRSYPKVGKRGIGVGYPHQVNLTFDAEQMRLAMIWKGKFANLSGVFRSQGHGTVQPLSRPLYFSAGPDLDDAATPWTVDDGRPPHHQFKGYSLDGQQRPKFEYQFGQIMVEDYFLDLVDSSSGKPLIRRSLTLNAKERQPAVVFRAATGQTIVPEGDHLFLIDNALRVRIDDNHAGTVVDSPDGKQLRVLLNVVPGTSTLTLDYVW